MVSGALCAASAMLLTVTFAQAVTAMPDRAAAAASVGADATQCSGQGRTEWVSCVSITGRLGSAPAVGGRAELTVEVVSQIDIDRVRIQVDLPDLLRWDKTPDGVLVERRASTVPSDHGAVTSAVTVVDLKAGQPWVLNAGVTAVRTGSTVLRLRATSSIGVAGGGEVHVPLTIGAQPATSILGMPEGDDAAAPTPKDAVVTPANPHLAYVPASTEGLPQPVPSGTPAPQQLSCVTGSFEYRDNDGAFHASKNLQYQVWDDDIGGDDLLTVGLTDGNGGYQACFDNRDSIGGRGGQDVYVRAVTESGQWRIQDHDEDPFAFHSGTHDELGDGRTHDFGRLHTANPADMPAYHAYDQADDAASFTPGQCWDEHDEDCRLIQVEWEPGSTEGTLYDPNDDEVRLRGPDPNTPWVVLHELGHAVMDDVYDDDGYPRVEDDCLEHFVTRQEGPICAWVEGFADWYGVAVLDNPDIPQHGNVETATWGTPGWDNGDRVEGRIAGALWDLDDIDPVGGEVWDAYDDSLTNIWNTFLGPADTTRAANTFHDYWTHRGQDGHNVGDLALGALFQNTIDYGFRQPLTDGAEQVRPVPLVPHNYTYQTQFLFWSVVALRSPAGADYDLILFDDRDQQQQLADSIVRTEIDFVAVDSNAGRRPLGDYYPRVVAANGTDNYVIELADAGDLLPAATTRAMGVNDLVAVWDLCLAAGQEVTVTVTPGAPTQDAELFIMRSDAGNPATHVRDRVSAVATADNGGPGTPETITYTAPEASCHGVVLVNQAGTGTYTITRT
jgi:hypothetical protein